MLGMAALVTAVQVRLHHIGHDTIIFQSALSVQVQCKMTCAFLQLVCELLALKNDIIAWRKKKSMVGTSRTSGENINTLFALIKP